MSITKVQQVSKILSEIADDMPVATEDQEMDHRNADDRLIEALKVISRFYPDFKEPIERMINDFEKLPKWYA